MKNFTYRTICIIAATVVLFGCNSSNEQALPVIDVESAYNNITGINLSEYASSIDYIPLETGENSLIAGNTISMRIEPADDKVAIYSPNTPSASDVLVFGHNGKFISKIGTQGRSDEEYTSVTSVISSGKNFEIIDRNKVVVYAGDGSFLKNIPIKRGGVMVGVKFFKLNNGGYIYLTEDIIKHQDYITITDAEGNETTKRIISEMEMAQTPGNMMPPKGGGVSFGIKRQNESPMLVPGLDGHYVLMNEKDTVFSINGMAEITPKYTVNYGKYTPGAYLNTFLFESDKFIASRALFKAQLYPNIDKNYRFLYLIYDKKSKQTRGMEVDPVTKSAGFINDLDKGGISFYPVAVKDGKMYQLIDAIKFMEFAEQSSSAKMKEVAATLNEDSNPVLVIVKLK